MNKRQLHTYFEQVNHLLFNGELPKPKLQISNKSGPYWGLCEISALRGQPIRSCKITIFKKELDNTDMSQFFKNIFIHELVHYYIALKAGKDVRNMVNLFTEHDLEIFQGFAGAAFELELIEIPELFA